MTSTTYGTEQGRPKGETAYRDLPQPDVTAIIIGAGFAGMGAGHRLVKMGLGDFLIFDKASGVGGTWRANTYPGIEVDIPSIAYSYPEAPNPDWSHVFASGAELLRYAEDCAEKFKLGNKFRFNTEVLEIDFDENADLWWIRARDSEGEFTMTTRFVISCHGALSTPARPQIPGLDSFAGKLILSQQWDHGYSLEGKRAAVIGTGASGIQIVPAIAPTVRHLTVFQRTPCYVAPKVNLATPAALRLLLRYLPFLQRILRLGGTATIDLAQTVGVVHHRQFPLLAPLFGAVVKASMRARITDKKLREQLIPTYGFACKRPSSSGDYLETFARPDVTLVTEPIGEIVPEGIRTADGTLHRLDVLVLATGFAVFDLPYRVTGSGGKDLASTWEADRLRAFQGVSVPSFPNLFLAPGPYGVIGFNWFDTVRICTGHATAVIRETLKRAGTRAEVTEQAFEEFAGTAVAAADNSVFKSANCAGSNTYYLDSHGDTPFLRPSSILSSSRLARSASSAYRYSRRHPDAADRVEV